MDKRTTIFLDIDGTLIDINQRPTISTLPKLILEMRNEGFQFGLNSNRAKEDVLPIIDEFNLNGPFILENGAYMIDVDGSHVSFAAKKLNIKEILLDCLPALFPDFQVSEADTTLLYLDGFEQAKVGKFIYINKFRLHSGSIHHRIAGKSDYSFTEEMSQSLNAYFQNNNLSDLVAVPHLHGHSVTVELLGITKGTGSKSYKSRHPERKVIAIGDGINDLSLKDYVDELYAVANAHSSLKEVSVYTSNFSITRGVEDILLRIKNASN